MNVAYVVLILATVCPAVNRGDGPTADAVAQRFFAHLEANQPVVGEFEVVTTIDYSNLPGGGAPRPAAKGGNTAVPEPAKQTLHCRWAWATGREVCEQLSGSHDSLYGFLSLPEGTLVGYSDKRYNLVRPDTLRTDITRPALFYFLSGANTWKKQLASSRFTLHTPTDPATDILEAADEFSKVVLTLDKKTSRLRSGEIYFKGKLGWRLAIDSYATSQTDGRAFPTAATITTYLVEGGGKSDKPFRTATLTARRVEFPTTAEAAGQFRLPMPAQSLIADRIMNASVLTNRPIDAAQVLTQDVPREAYSAPAKEPPEGRTRKGLSAVLIALLAAPLLGYGAYALIRHRLSRGRTALALAPPNDSRRPGS
jgi:hypothetical protein